MKIRLRFSGKSLLAALAILLCGFYFYIMTSGSVQAQHDFSPSVIVVNERSAPVNMRWDELKYRGYYSESYIDTGLTGYYGSLNGQLISADPLLVSVEGVLQIHRGDHFDTSGLTMGNFVEYWQREVLPSPTIELENGERVRANDRWYETEYLGYRAIILERTLYVPSYSEWWGESHVDYRYHGSFGSIGKYIALEVVPGGFPAIISYELYAGANNTTALGAYDVEPYLVSAIGEFEVFINTFSVDLTLLPAADATETSPVTDPFAGEGTVIPGAGQTADLPSPAQSDPPPGPRINTPSWWDGFAALPLPDNLAQLAAAVVIPGLLTLLLGALGHATGRGAPTFQPSPKLNELEQFKQQYDQWLKTADPDDSNYEQGRREYEVYLDYLEQKEAYALAEAERIKEEAYRAAVLEKEKAERKAQWITERRLDLETLEEEKAFLDANIRGYGGAGIDVSAHRERLSQVEERLGELRKQLQKEGVNTAYQARSRQAIGPDKELLEFERQAENQGRALDQLVRMRQTARNLNLTEEGANIHDRLGEMLDRLGDGKEPPNPKDIARIRNYIGGRVTGAYLSPDQLPNPQLPWWFDAENWSEALGESGRNLTTFKTVDGQTSWLGLGGRLGIGMATGGASEWVFAPVGSLYTMKGAIDSGSSSLGAFGAAVTQVVVKEGLTRFAGGLLKAGSGALSEAYGSSGGGAMQVLKGGARGAWSSVNTSLGNQIGQVHDLFNRQAWENTVNGFQQSLAGGSERIVDIITGKEGYVGPTPTSALSYVKEKFFSTTAPPQLTALEQAKLEQFNRAVASGNPNQVMALYKNKGMQQLAELQKKGVISGAAAQKCNAILGSQVNDAVQDGTRNAITDLQSQTNVKIKQVLVGDSGSSAKNVPIRLKTDYDRTLVAEFNQADLQNYATRNQMNLSQAYKDLCQKLQKAQKDAVNKALIDKGLTNDDVGYAAYKGLGSSAGQADAYPASFTNARQATSGSAKVYRVSADGTAVGKPYQTSGQSLVDQDHLNITTYNAANISIDPTKILPADTKPILQLQLPKIFKDGSATADSVQLAKSLQRFHRQAQVGQYSQKVPGFADEISWASQESLAVMPDNLVKAAKEIYANPGVTDTALIKHGFIDATGNADMNSFLRAGEGALKNAARFFDLELP